VKPKKLDPATKEIAAKLEARAREIHKVSNPPRLTELKINPETGVAEIFLLGKARIRFLANKQVEILDRNFREIALGAQPHLTEVKNEVSTYLAQLLTRAETDLGTKDKENLPLCYARAAVFGKLRHTLWGLPADQNLFKVFLSYLWTCVDREVASLTFQIESPARASLSLYRWVFTNRELLVEARQKTPNLLPLVNRYQTLFSGSDPWWETQGEFGGAFHESVLPQDWAKRIKTKMLEEGLTEAGWRTLTYCGPQAVKAWRSAHGWDCNLLNMAGIAGIKGIPAHFIRVFGRSRFPDLIRRKRLDSVSRATGTEGYLMSYEDALTLVRLALTEAEKARKKKRLQAFLNGELMLVLDALFAQYVNINQREAPDFEDHYFHLEGGLVEALDPKPDKATATFKLPRQVSWKWLVRFQERWHEEMAAKAYSAENNVCWESLVASFEHDGFEAVPLTDGHALYLEGKTMHHCVNSPYYATACQEGRSRIFSIRKPGVPKSLATVELMRPQYREEGPGAWRLSQCFGFGNSTAPKAVAKMAAEIQKRYAKAQRKYDRELEKQSQAAASEPMSTTRPATTDFEFEEPFREAA
jgi:hypothetical protein